MYDVTALGEVLIDFTEAGTSENGMSLFERNPGGAPANVLVALEHLGHDTAFIGKVGTDMHGVFLREVLEGERIDCTGLVSDPDCFTTLAFVGLSPTGERTFSFARKPGADTQLAPEELAREVIASSKVFHVGSLSLTDEPVRSATHAAIKLAREAGCTLSYDPNYRANLWPSAEVATEHMRSIVADMDLMKISDEECALMTGVSDPVQASALLLERGPKVVAVTLGGSGALVRTADGVREVPGFPAKVVDTTGAGDSFWGGFLAAFVENGRAAGDVTVEEAARFARMGNAVASLCVRSRGGIPAMPSRSDVEALLTA